MSSVPGFQEFLKKQNWGQEITQKLAAHGVTSAKDAEDKTVKDYAAMKVPLSYAQVLAETFSYHYTAVSKRLKTASYGNEILKKFFDERYLTLTVAKKLDTEVLELMGFTANKARRLLRLFRDDTDYLTFISHTTAVENDPAEELYRNLLKEKEFDETNVFYDSEVMTDLSEIKQHVGRARTMIVLISNAYFLRPYCILELVTAYTLKIPICACVVDPNYNKSVFKEVDHRWNNLVDAGATKGQKFLEAQGITLEKFKEAMSYLENRIYQKLLPKGDDAGGDEEVQSVKMVINSLRDCLIEAAAKSTSTVTDDAQEQKGSD